MSEPVELTPQEIEERVDRVLNWMDPIPSGKGPGSDPEQRFNGFITPALQNPPSYVSERRTRPSFLQMVPLPQSGPTFGESLVPTHATPEEDCDWLRGAGARVTLTGPWREPYGDSGDRNLVKYSLRADHTVDIPRLGHLHISYTRTDDATELRGSEEGEAWSKRKVEESYSLVSDAPRPSSRPGSSKGSAAGRHRHVTSPGKTSHRVQKLKQKVTAYDGMVERHWSSRDKGYASGYHGSGRTVPWSHEESGSAPLERNLLLDDR